MSRRWCSTLWPTPAAAEHAGHRPRRLRRLRRAARCSSTGPTRSRPGASCATSRTRSSTVSKGADELRIEADGTDLSLRTARRTWVNSDGRRNMPSGEVFTGPHESSASGRIRFTRPVLARRRAGQRRRARVPRRRGRRRARRRRARTTCDRALDTDAGARRLGEVGIGTNFGITRAIGADAVRREDRRHRPPRARPLLPRDGRAERVRAALGPDLRPARRRAPERRRRHDHARTAASPEAAPRSAGGQPPGGR